MSYSCFLASIRELSSNVVIQTRQNRLQVRYYRLDSTLFSAIDELSFARDLLRTSAEYRAYALAEIKRLFKGGPSVPAP